MVKFDIKIIAKNKGLKEEVDGPIKVPAEFEKECRSICTKTLTVENLAKFVSPRKYIEFCIEGMFFLERSNS